MSLPKPAMLNILRQPNFAVHTYRCLQILIGRANDFLRDFMFHFVNHLIYLLVAGNFAVLTIHDRMPELILYGGAICDIFATCFFLLGCQKLGELHGLSRKFTISWSRSATLVGSNKKLMKKYISSCRPNAYALGSVGYFQKLTGLRTVGKIIYYTCKLLILMKKKWMNGKCTLIVTLSNF